MTVGNLWQLAALPDMPSVPTLRRLMRDFPAFPVIKHGRMGNGYAIDLEAAAAFVRAHWGDARHRKPYGSPPPGDHQMSLPFTFGDHAND